MNKIKLGILLTMLFMIFGTAPAQAEFSSRLIKELKLTFAPMDIEISSNGRRVFVLDDHGQLLVYNVAGQLKDKIQVGKKVEKIRISPREDMLVLSNRDDKTVRILKLAYIHAIDISGSPYKGPSNAPVAIVVFSDFQCPYCERIRTIFDKIREQYPKQVKVVYMQFPLSSHKYSLSAAKASIAAAAQGKFWEFHDLIFNNYKELNDSKFQEFRSALKLDKTKFDQVMESPETLVKINKDKRQGVKADVRGTPTVFVNGRMIRPAVYQNIKVAVEESLKDLKK